MEFLEPFIYNISPLLTSGSGSVFEDTILHITNNDFIFKRTLHAATDDRINVKILNPNTGRYLFKGSDDLRHISGKSISGITAYGFVPYNWPIPYRVKGDTRLKLQLADASSGSNQLYLAYHGNKVLSVPPLDMHGEPIDYNKEKSGRLRIMPIVYESPSITTGADVGAQAQQAISIDDDSDFVCTRITGVLSGTGTTGFVTLQSVRQNQYVYWQNQKTYLHNLIGNGQFPNNLTSPMFIQRNAPVLITFENLAAGAKTLQLFLSGYKRF